MNVLLDENIPHKLKWRLVEREIDVLTVPERGWAGMTSGELLDRAENDRLWFILGGNASSAGLEFFGGPSQQGSTVIS